MIPEVRKPTEEEIQQAESWPVWEKEVSSFQWEYSEKETCLLLEGEVVVTTDDGSEIKFGKGDMVVFPKGLICQWDIKQAVRKHYTFG